MLAEALTLVAAHERLKRQVIAGEISHEERIRRIDVLHARAKALEAAS